MKKQTEYIPLPPECINFKGVEFWLDQRIQSTPLGKRIRYSGIRVNEDMPDKYGKRHWIYTFIYLDGSGLLEFECDYDNNIKRYVQGNNL
jgi:hypothetical protein